LVSQPDPIDESPVATAKPSARYGAMSGARAAGFATAELHHALGRDLERLAAREDDRKLKANLEQLVAAYRTLAEHRAQMLNIPLPKCSPPKSN
jgi:hypothetical protein